MPHVGAHVCSTHTHTGAHSHTYAGTKKNSGGDALEDEVRQVVQEAQEKKKAEKSEYCDLVELVYQGH